jgi:hypothetical protein
MTLSSLLSSFFPVVYNDGTEQPENKDEPQAEEIEEIEGTVPAEEEGATEEEPEDVRIPHPPSCLASSFGYIGPPCCYRRMPELAEVRASDKALRALPGESSRWTGIQARGLRRGTVSAFLNGSIMPPQSLFCYSCMFRARFLYLSLLTRLSRGSLLSPVSFSTLVGCPSDLLSLA